MKGSYNIDCYSCLLTIVLGNSYDPLPEIELQPSETNVPNKIITELLF